MGTDGEAAETIFGAAVTVLEAQGQGVPEGVIGAQKPQPEGLERTVQRVQAQAGERPVPAGPGAENRPVLGAGTPAAQRSEQMKQCPTQNETAAPAADLSPEAESPTARARTKFEAIEGAKPGKTALPELTSLEAGNLREPPSPDKALGAEAPQTAPMGRLFEGILHEAAIVRRLQPDSLAVVLRPDAQTEILLRLEQRNGQLEASARCDRGDYQFLTSHWPELRQCLEHQGIRLLDLEQRPDNLLRGAGAGLGGFSHRRPSADSEAAPALPASSRRSGAGATRPGPARSVFKPNRLFESWA